VRIAILWRFATPVAEREESLQPASRRRHLLVQLPVGHGDAQPVVLIEGLRKNP
jgi:hypothetical protein